MDFMLNGQASGNVATTLLRSNFNINALRPIAVSDDENDPRGYIMNADGKGYKIITNAPTAMRYDDWKKIDEIVLKTAKPRLKAVNTIRGNGQSYTLANGMAYTSLQTERQSDISPAIISMDGNRQSEGDRPVFDIINLPLPLIHKDFQLPLRQVLSSRNGGSPLDTTTVELAARRCAEQAEQLLLGTAPTYAFGGGTVYGITNFPNRITYTMTNPAGGGYLPSQTLADILAMKLASQNAYHFGPWTVLASLDWDQYLDNDYIINTNGTTSGVTLRERIKKIDGITDVVTVDYLPTKTMVLVMNATEVCRMVIGMDFVTVQWETNGGFMLNYKIIGIMVPQVRADIVGNSGIVHGTHA